MLIFCHFCNQDNLTWQEHNDMRKDTQDIMEIKTAIFFITGSPHSNPDKIDSWELS